MALPDVDRYGFHKHFKALEVREDCWLLSMKLESVSLIALYNFTTALAPFQFGTILCASGISEGSFYDNLIRVIFDAFVYCRRYERQIERLPGRRSGTKQHAPSTHVSVNMKRTSVEVRCRGYNSNLISLSNRSTTLSQRRTSKINSPLLRNTETFYQL